MATVSGRALRYAQAAFEVARDAGALDDWETQLTAVAAVMDDPLLRKALTSPVVPRDRKESMILSAFPELDERVKNFLVLLVRRDRLNLLPDILAVFRQRLNEHLGVQIVEVTTATALDQATRDRLAEGLARYLEKQIVIEPRVDPEIIAGVVVRVGDRVLDGSIRGRLDRMRQALARPA